MVAIRCRTRISRERAAGHRRSRNGRGATGRRADQARPRRSRHRNMAESVMAIDIAGLVDTKRGLIGRPIFIGRAGVSARYRIPNPLDIWRRVLNCVSALYPMTAEVLRYRRYRSPGSLHHALNEFGALMRQQVPEPSSDQRVARRPRSPCLSPAKSAAARAGLPLVRLGAVARRAPHKLADHG